MGFGLVGLGTEVPFANEVRMAVLKAFGVDAKKLGTIKLDEAAFEKQKGQYDAQKLLLYLDGSWLIHWDEWGTCEKVLGVTSADIFVPGMTFVFGLASLSGKSGMVSSARLDPVFYGEKKNDAKLGERLGKEIVHEFGHLAGLQHCEDKGCVMSFSNSVKEVDAKGGCFCKECEGKLPGLKPV